jgi:hypothetical protein
MFYFYFIFIFRQSNREMRPASSDSNNVFVTNSDGSYSINANLRHQAVVYHRDNSNPNHQPGDDGNTCDSHRHALVYIRESSNSNVKQTAVVDERNSVDLNLQLKDNSNINTQAAAHQQNVRFNDIDVNHHQVVFHHRDRSIPLANVS